MAYYQQQGGYPQQQQQQVAPPQQQQGGPAPPINTAAAPTGPREYRQEWIEYIRYIGFDKARQVCPEQFQYLFPNEANQQAGQPQGPPPQQQQQQQYQQQGRY